MVAIWGTVRKNTIFSKALYIWCQVKVFFEQTYRGHKAPGTHCTPTGDLPTICLRWSPKWYGPMCWQHRLLITNSWHLRLACSTFSFDRLNRSTAHKSLSLLRDLISRITWKSDLSAGWNSAFPWMSRAYHLEYIHNELLQGQIVPKKINPKTHEIYL